MSSAHRIRWMCTVGLATQVLTVGTAGSQSSTTNPYRATFGWEKLPDGRAMGTVSGVFPDPDGRHLWILDRCGANQCAGTDLDPILKFDLDGNLVDSFGAGLFGFPHGFFLDHEGFLWVTDACGRCRYKSRHHGLWGCRPQSGHPARAPRFLRPSYPARSYPTTYWGY